MISQRTNPRPANSEVFSVLLAPFENHDLGKMDPCFSFFLVGKWLVFDGPSFSELRVEKNLVSSQRISDDFDQKTKWKGLKLFYSQGCVIGCL